MESAFSSKDCFSSHDRPHRALLKDRIWVSQLQLWTLKRRPFPYIFRTCGGSGIPQKLARQGLGGRDNDMHHGDPRNEINVWIPRYPKKQPPNRTRQRSSQPLPWRHRWPPGFLSGQPVCPREGTGSKKWSKPPHDISWALLTPHLGW